MRAGSKSDGPQNWQEFLERYRAYEQEEQERGRKWDDKPSESEVDQGVVRKLKGNDDLAARERYSNFVGYERYSILPSDWEIVANIPDLKPWMKKALEFLRDNGNHITRETEGMFAWQTRYDPNRQEMNNILFKYGFRVFPTSGGSGVYSLYRSR